MNIMRRLFGPTDDQLADRAATVVGASHVVALSTLVPTINRFPFLRDKNEEHFVFVLTIAGVYHATMRLKALHVERECKLKLVRKIMDELTNWNPGYGTVAFDTCMAFFDRTYNGTMKGGVEYDKSFLVADIIGFWLAWEVLDHAADTDEERHLARVLGVVIVRHFSNWWTQAA